MGYMPSRSEEELSSSGEDDLKDEFADMAGQGRHRHCSAVSQLLRASSQPTVLERVASQTDPDLASLPITGSSVASTSRCVRGKVVGSASEKRMKVLGGKMNVPLGAMSGAFEGVNASAFAVELGSHIRRIAPYDKPTWVMVDEGTREAIYVAALLQSQRNSMSRRQVHTTHTSGSQSFTLWLSLTPTEEVPSSQAELYRQQHWSKKKNKWITPHAEATCQRLELGLSQSKVSNSPVAQQQLIEEVLGKRVARRRGYRSRGPASVSSGTAVAIEMSSLQRR